MLHRVLTPDDERMHALLKLGNVHKDDMNEAGAEMLQHGQQIEITKGQNCIAEQAVSGRICGFNDDGTYQVQMDTYTTCSRFQWI